jgi:lysophospholipase L1-like esterase
LPFARGLAKVDRVSAEPSSAAQRAVRIAAACAILVALCTCASSRAPARGVAVLPAPGAAAASASKTHDAVPPAAEADGVAFDDASSAEAGAAVDQPAPELPLGAPTPIEDPGGHALDALHAALQRVGAERTQARIVFYGASHVASDLFTGALRQRLQQRFGEAGPGFVVPGRPWRFYRNAGISIEDSRNFRAFRIVERAPIAGIYGLAGVALDALRKPASSVIATRANGGLSGAVSRAELYYLKQPNGGHVNLFVDGRHMPRIATSAQRTEPGYAHWQLADGPHRFELRTQGDGPVRVFGIALERDRPGVILDTLGVPGTRVRDQLFWDDAVYREHLARRKPDMVVLAYGTNESGDDDVPLEQYAAHLRRVVQRVQEVAKGASCLLIGPSDRPVRNDDGTFAERPLTAQISDVQRHVAADLGCGFFDLQRFMGGSMSMLRWVAAVPPLGTSDYVHFTQAGYERLAAALHDDLLSGFDAPAEPPAVAAIKSDRHPRGTRRTP